MRTLSWLVLSVAWAAAVRADDGARFGTFEVDVVALIRDGTEAPGTEQHVLDRYGYRYRFSAAANRAAFLEAPERYEVQLGGACGKMAELSGRGSPKRFWVYNDRLFVFASDGCRTAFKANPEGHIERDDPKPNGTPEEAAEGRRLLELAAKWSGIDKLGKEASLTMTYTGTYQQAGQVLPMKSVVRVRANGEYFAGETYNGSGYAHELKQGKGLEIDPQGRAEELVPIWQRALERQRNRNLAHLLLARGSKDFLAFGRGSRDGVAEITVHCDGVTSTLFFAEATGRVVGLENTGRGRGGELGRVRRTYTQYDTLQGITCPVAWSATFNGEASKSHARDRVELTLDRS